MKRLNYKSSVVILIGMNLLGCAGSTTIQRQHHLFLDNSSKASVCFLRPKEGFMGVRGMPMGINLDGEDLLDLTIGEYTFVDLTPGRYDMVVTNWTVEGSNNAMVKTSRTFVLNFAEADSVFLLFNLEKISFWEILGQKYEEWVDKLVDDLAQKLINKIYPDTMEIQFGKHVSVQFTSQSNPRQNKSQPGIGYAVESVSRQTAVQVVRVMELEPVEGAQHSPLQR